MDNASVLRLLEGIADAADSISGQDIAYCLSALAQNRLGLTLSSVVQVKMYYWALCQLVRRARRVLGTDEVAVEVPSLSAQDENASRALRIGARMFSAWLSKSAPRREPLAAVKK